jgi:hypothetical protein
MAYPVVTTVVRNLIFVYALYSPFLVAYFGIPTMGDIHEWGSIAILLGGALFTFTIFASDYCACRGSIFASGFVALLGVFSWLYFLIPSSEQESSVEQVVVMIWLSPFLLLILHFAYRVYIQGTKVARTLQGLR